MLRKNEGEKFSYIFFETEMYSFTEIKNLLDKYHIEGKIIFKANEELSDSDTEYFQIPNISFRDFSEEHGAKIHMSDVLK